MNLRVLLVGMGVFIVLAGCLSNSNPASTSNEPPELLNTGNDDSLPNAGGRTASIGGESSEETPTELLPSVPQEPVVDPNAKPMLQNLGVNFGPWNKQTNMAGDFLFQKGLFDDKLFFEFGTYLVGNNGPKLIPELTYYLPDKTKIFSPVNGKISQITKLYSDDYAVHIRTSPDSQWLVTFEHVENLIVQEGQTVEVGTILGEASTFGGGEGVSFTELVVWKGGATLNDIIKWCPVPLLDPLVRVEYEEKFVQLTKDWETYIGKDIYDEEEWVAPGCIREQMTEYEAMNPGA